MCQQHAYRTHPPHTPVIPNPNLNLGHSCTHIVVARLKQHKNQPQVNCILGPDIPPTSSSMRFRAEAVRSLSRFSMSDFFAMSRSSAAITQI